MINAIDNIELHLLFSRSVCMYEDERETSYLLFTCCAIDTVRLFDTCLASSCDCKLRLLLQDAVRVDRTRPRFQNDRAGEECPVVWTARDVA